MDCTTFETSLPLFIDGTFDDDSAVRMEAHLRDCTACAALYTSHRVVDGCLSDADPVAAPPGFDARLFEAIAREEALEQLALSWKRQIFVAAAAFVGAIPVYGWMMYWWLRSDSPRLSGMFAGMFSDGHPVADLRGQWSRILDTETVSGIGALLAQWMKPIPLPSTDITVSPMYLAGMIVVLAALIWYESAPLTMPRYHGAVPTGRR